MHIIRYIIEFNHLQYMLLFKYMLLKKVIYALYYFMRDTTDRKDNQHKLFLHYCNKIYYFIKVFKYSFMKLRKYCRLCFKKKSNI